MTRVRICSGIKEKCNALSNHLFPQDALYQYFCQCLAQVWRGECGCSSSVTQIPALYDSHVPVHSYMSAPLVVTIRF